MFGAESSSGREAGLSGGEGKEDRLSLRRREDWCLRVQWPLGGRRVIKQLMQTSHLKVKAVCVCGVSTC